MGQSHSHRLLTLEDIRHDKRLNVPKLPPDERKALIRRFFPLTSYQVHQSILLVLLFMKAQYPSTYHALRQRILEPAALFGR